MYDVEITVLLIKISIKKDRDSSGLDRLDPFISNI